MKDLTREMVLQSVELEINGNKVQVIFPDRIDQQIEIESYKAILSFGKYAILSMNNIGSSERLLDVVDMFSHFLVVVPDFLKLIEVQKSENLMKVNRRITDPLVKTFNSEYAKFYNQFVSREERIGPLQIRLEASKFDKTEEEKLSEKFPIPETEAESADGTSANK